MEKILTQYKPMTTTLRLNDLNLYVFSLAFALGNLLLPVLVHRIPQGGLIFLPLFFFTLVAAWQYGVLTGVLVALASPLLNHLLTGMPALAVLPLILSKSLVLALVASLMGSRQKTLNPLTLLVPVFAMVLTGLVFEQLSQVPLQQSFKGLQLSFPGLVIMVLGGYLIIRLIQAKIRPE